MIIILSLIFITCVCIAAIIIGNKSYKINDIIGPLPYFILFFVFALFSVFIGIKMDSYSSYLKYKTFHSYVSKEYKIKIDIYTKKAFEFESLNKNSKEITDMKYNNYQEQLGKMLTEYTNEIIAYNYWISSNRALRKNIITSWLVVAPDDDMKPLSIEELTK